jgi:predicted nucleic acid-binding protein
MRLLLDTCVLSELQKPTRSGAVVAFIDGQPDGLLHVSVITIGEIAKGIALLPDGLKKQTLESWRVTLAGQFEDRILPVDQETAEIWGELSAAEQKKGVAIPIADGLIAATAMRHGLHVASRDTLHFKAAGAMVINPWLGPIASSH